MNNQELNKPHIKTRVQDSNGIETIEMARVRTRVISLTRDYGSTEIREKISTLMTGDAVIIGGSHDIKYIKQLINASESKKIISKEEAISLRKELGKVDPNLSSYAERLKRKTIVVSTTSNQVNPFTQKSGIIDSQYRLPEAVSEEEAQKIVIEKGLEDGIYTLQKEWRQVYIIVRSGKIQGQVFSSSDYDIGYMKRSSKDLTYRGIINVE